VSHVTLWIIGRKNSKDLARARNFRKNEYFENCDSGEIDPMDENVFYFWIRLERLQGEAGYRQYTSDPILRPVLSGAGKISSDALTVVYCSKKALQSAKMTSLENASNGTLICWKAIHICLRRKPMKMPTAMSLESV